MRVGIEFRKEGAARFLSHLELMRLWERALRRAGLPLAYSQGFNPHPRFSLASALALGIASAREYLEVELAGRLQAEEIAGLLAPEMPPGLAVNRVRELRPGTRSLTALIDRAAYSLEAPLTRPLAPGELKAALERFWQAPLLEVMRKTKSGVGTYDPRPLILELAAEETREFLFLNMKVQAGGKGNVRPEEVARALAEAAGLPINLDALRFYRTGLFVSNDGGDLDPLEALGGEASV